MAKIHNDTSSDLETKSEFQAIYVLLKKVGNDKRKAYKVLDEINWYPSPDVVGKANMCIAAEQTALKKLNSIFR